MKDTMITVSLLAISGLITGFIVGIPVVGAIIGGMFGLFLRGAFRDN